MWSSHRRSPGCASGLAVAAILLAPACGESPPNALDLTLVPNASVNALEDLVEALDHLELRIDSPEGLYAESEAHVGGGVRLINLDGDPELELVATLPRPADRLPRVRILRGGVPEVSLSVDVVGEGRSAGDEPVAAGGVHGIRFLPEGVSAIALDFNLLAPHLRLRVLRVWGACRDRCIGVEFSRPVDPESLEGEVRVGEREPTFVDSCETLGPVVGPRTELGLVLPAGITDPETLEVRVGAGVLDMRGLGLDQLAAEPGAQGYTSAPLPWGELCDDPITVPLCTVNAGCAPGYACIRAHCTPVAACATAPCSTPYVCDPGSDECVVDCRAYGDYAYCPPAAPVCDATYGVCVADDGA